MRFYIDHREDKVFECRANENIYVSSVTSLSEADRRLAENNSYALLPDLESDLHKERYGVSLRSAEDRLIDEVCENRGETEIVSTDVDLDSDGCTVDICAISDERKVTFSVQTMHGRYRRSLGCEIYADGEGVDIDFDDYEDFDMGFIIRAANEVASRFMTRTEYTLRSDAIYVQEISDGYKVLVENAEYMNADASQYDVAYFELSEVIFETEEEAIEHARDIAE